jgi:hypothetical protein
MKIGMQCSELIARSFMESICAPESIIESVSQVKGKLDVSLLAPGIDGILTMQYFVSTKNIVITGKRETQDLCVDALRSVADVYVKRCLDLEHGPLPVLRCQVCTLVLRLRNPPWSKFLSESSGENVSSSTSTGTPAPVTPNRYVPRDENFVESVQAIVTHAETQLSSWPEWQIRLLTYLCREMGGRSEYITILEEHSEDY